MGRVGFGILANVVNSYDRRRRRIPGLWGDLLVRVFDGVAKLLVGLI